MSQALNNRYLTLNMWWSLFSNVALSLLMHVILTVLPTSSMLGYFFLLGNWISPLDGPTFTLSERCFYLRTLWKRKKDLLGVIFWPHNLKGDIYLHHQHTCIWPYLHSRHWIVESVWYYKLMHSRTRRYLVGLPRYFCESLLSNLRYVISGGLTPCSPMCIGMFNS